MRLLLIEDEPDLADTLARGLRKQGYVVDVCLDGELGLEMAQVYDYDLLILDLSLPKLDGMDICRQLRANRDELLILMLTARSELSDRVAGLEIGADDYLAKPFHWPELLARIRALLRRDWRARGPILTCGELRLDPTAMVAHLGDHPLELTPKQFAILEYLLRHQGEMVSQQELVEHVWDASVNTFTNAVRVHINALRQKLGERADTPGYIETVVGKGYRLSAPSIAASGAAALMTVVPHR